MNPGPGCVCTTGQLYCTPLSGSLCCLAFQSKPLHVGIVYVQSTCATHWVQHTRVHTHTHTHTHTDLYKQQPHTHRLRLDTHTQRRLVSEYVVKRSVSSFPTCLTSVHCSVVFATRARPRWIGKGSQDCAWHVLAGLCRPTVSSRWQPDTFHRRQEGERGSKLRTSEQYRKVLP